VMIKWICKCHMQSQCIIYGQALQFTIHDGTGDRSVKCLQLPAKLGQLAIARTDVVGLITITRTYSFPFMLNG
jgi:hypothetical protein